MMRRLRALGTGRSARGSSSLTAEDRGSRGELPRRGGRAAPPLPSSRSRRGRGRTGLPLTQKKKEASADDGEEENEPVAVEATGSDSSEHSKEPSDAEPEDPTPKVEGDGAEDHVEDTEKSQDVDDKEEAEPRRTRSSSTATADVLEAIFNDKLVTVTVTVGGDDVANSSSPVSISSSKLRSRRILSATREEPSTTTEPNATKGTRTLNGRSGSGSRTVLGNDGNQFYCHVCKDFGDVVCCDGCPRVYHPTCIPLEDPSRQSLDNDEDPWFCPDCFNKKQKGISSTSLRSRNHERRMVRRKCSECQEPGGDIPMEPCDGCGVFLHHPSCLGQEENGEASVLAPMCSNCKAEAVVADEETERVEGRRKKRKLSDQDNDAPVKADETQEEEDSSSEGASRDGQSRRKRSRSVDTVSDDNEDLSDADDDDDDDEEEDDENDSDDSSEHGQSKKADTPSFIKGKGVRPPIRHKLLGETLATAGDASSSKKRRGRPPLTLEEKQERAAERAELARQKHKKKKKKKKKRKKKKRRLAKEAKAQRLGTSSRGSPTNGDMMPLSTPLRAHHGLVKATPAFFFFLSDNRLKIERVLSRKKPLFNRLPKGIERTELIAKEGALWWIKARPSEHQRYMNMSMRDFEEQVIAWKEEKNIKDMIMSGDSDNEMEGEKDSDLVSTDDDNDLAPEDELVTYNNHQRLYVATSVGSKPFAPEPGKSNNRVLLELLQDMRFHPLPMFNPHRTDIDVGQPPYSKMTIPYFDVHGPVSTSVGDECLGCARGWNHFCPVLQRRLPAVEHRARLQPPLSSLVATRIGLGLQKDSLDADQQALSPFGSKEADVFSVRETQEAVLAKCLPQVQSYFLSQPSTRADDVVQFVEEAVAMKIPEPHPPHPPATRSEPAKKSMLARGALPTRGRKKNADRSEGSSVGESGDDGRSRVVRKCGRCRTIIKGETGCIQCRRAQLVINMSKRQPVSAHTSSRGSKRDGGAVVSNANFLKVQTAMVGRLTLKESNFDKQSEGDRAVSTAMTNMRWAPNTILPPQKFRVPTPKPEIVEISSSEHENDEAMDVDEEELDQSEHEGSPEKDMEGSEEKTSEDVAKEETPKESPSSSSKEEEEEEQKPPSRLIPTRAARQRTSARLGATGSNSAGGANDIWEPTDRQEMAQAHQEEANELHQRCLSVACSGILLAMMRRDPLWLFAEPVPASVVGYSKIVKEPIDFGRIRTKVLDGKYSSFGAFINDARLLCTNALAFNPPGSIYWKTAKELYDVLEVMQKRASDWIGAIRDAHASSFAWRRTTSGHRQDMVGDSSSPGGADHHHHKDSEDVDHDPFKELRETWPEAVEMIENGDWARRQIDADFMRTRENEYAYYGSLAVRRVAVAAESSLSQYPDQGGTHNVVVRRSHTEDENLRRHVDDCVSKLVNPVQLKDIPSWREETIIRILRRVQSRRVEGRIASENGCARCDGISIEPEAKMAMTAESIRWGRNKKKGELDTLPRIDQSRLALSTGLASAKARELVEQEKEQDEKTKKVGKVSDVSVSVRGSRIHGWGLFADQPFKQGEVVAEYIGEYISNPVADAREKMYQEQRIQDYQFRVDENLVIDATLRGGHGRYINHNCNPNCIAKIIDGEAPNQHLKRVLIISQRDIKAREEVTYDYQFPLELDLDERIPCNCGSMLCRGFMNWDLPEKGSKNRVMRTQKRGGNMRDRIRRLGRPLKK